jgi:hypothetical protein
MAFSHLFEGEGVVGLRDIHCCVLALKILDQVQDAIYTPSLPRK